MAERSSPSEPASALSVVIPVGPDERAWSTLLHDLHPLPAGSEVILVATVGAVPPDADASMRPVRWIEAATGRASQLNAGIAAARNAVLWLLHADSRVPERALHRLLARPPQSDELGYFDLRFTDGPPMLRLNALGVWMRSRLLRMPFGDQGFVLHRRTLLRLGGFDTRLDCGEDHDLVWRARRAGIRLRPIGATIRTSGRKYSEHGWCRTTAHHVRLSWQQANAFRGKRPP